MKARIYKRIIKKKAQIEKMLRVIENDNKKTK